MHGQVTAIISALITVRKDGGFSVDGLLKRWDDSRDLAVHGVAFLVHGLIDDIVDGHFSAVQVLDDQIEQLQDQLFTDSGVGNDVQRRSFELRKSAGGADTPSPTSVNRWIYSAV
jgi:magnesium transporter